MIAPFPWPSLPRVSPAHVRAVASVRRRYPRARDVAANLSQLLGHPVSIDVRRVGVARTDFGARGAIIALGEIVLEIEAELALAVASALAGGKLPKIARDRTIDPEVLGAAAGIAQWLARESGIEVSLTEDTLRGVECVIADCTVRVGVLRTAARVAVAIPELDRSARLPALDALHLLGSTPLTMSAVVGWGIARAAELADLRLGDVVVADHKCSALIGATTGMECELEGDRRVRIRDGRVELAAPAPPNEEAAAMTDETGATMQIPALAEGGKLAEDLAELPLLVRIEIGNVTLPARDWAAIGPGDTLVLDGRVGDPVSLRIGGTVMARGELVDVDGAVGVRITERVG